MPKTTYSYSYDVTKCPECDHDLTEDYGVTIHFVVADQTRETRSRLTTEGNLVDVDDLVANGYHAGTSCGNCGESLADFEECSEPDLCHVCNKPFGPADLCDCEVEERMDRDA